MNGAATPRRAGRPTGVVYLVMIVTAAGGYSTMTRLLAGDAPAVLERLAASPATFNFAFAAMAIGFVVWVVLAFLLYGLMGAAGRGLGAAMLVLTVAGAAVNLLALRHLLPLVGAPAAGMDAAALEPMVASYNRVLLLAQVFSGLWLFPFGWLVLRSRIVPPLLGACLFVGGFGYLLVFATAFSPNLEQITAYTIVSAILGVPAILGEFGMCLWLLIKGARVGV
jgi:hypothetical protein